MLLRQYYAEVIQINCPATYIHIHYTRFTLPSLSSEFNGQSKINVKIKLLGWYPCTACYIETPTHIETRTHDQCGDTIEKSQAPDDGCINVRNMLSIEVVK